MVLRDAAQLAATVAERFDALTAPPTSAPFTVALAGGSTPKRLYGLLAAPPHRDRVRWDAVEFFFGDERAVPPEHPDSNYGMAKRALLDRVPSPAHRMAAERDDAAGYARLLGERVTRRRNGVPALDLVLLGIGEDGHTASLFPGTAALAERARVGRDERGAAAAYAAHDAHLSGAQRGGARMGADRRRRKARDRGTSVSPPPPAAKRLRPILGVRPTAGELVWFLDEAAAPGN